MSEHKYGCAVPGCTNIAEIRGVCVACFKKYSNGDTTIKQYLETDPAKIREGRRKLDKPICPMPGCDRSVTSRGLCDRHYQAAVNAPNTPGGREALPFLKPSSRRKKRTASAKLSRTRVNARQKPNGGRPRRTKNQTPEQSSPPADSVMLNVAAMATQLRNALAIVTGAPATMCELQGGFVFIASDPTDAARTKLLYLSGEGIVRPAKIEIE